jgi:S-methylmethionine-dependent homocysteine/selenocysteine methylase
MSTATSTNANLLSQHLNRLKSSPHQSLLLDGGTGEELFLNGVPDDRKIWSATAIVHEKHHSTVEKVHRSFVDAGSQAITTNSYGIIPGVGFTDGEEVKKLMGIAGQIARRAVTDESGTASVLVLGSLGPLVESYRADLIMNHEDGVRCYQYGIEGLNPYVDVYLAETMSCTEEACQVIDALHAFYSKADNNFGTNLHEKQQQPLLVSFTLGSDGKLRSGESVVDAIPKMVCFALDREVQREYSCFEKGLFLSTLCIIALVVFHLFSSMIQHHSYRGVVQLLRTRGYNQSTQRNLLQTRNI